MAYRLRGRCGYPADEPFRVTMHPDKMDVPRRWKTPRRVFVVSMGDLFHAAVPGDYRDKILDVIRDTPRHTFLMLTKRPERMADYFARQPVPENVWLGITVEDQARANERLPILRAIDAPVRFVSAEPLLESVDLGLVHRDRIGWVIAGAETSPWRGRARYMAPVWAASLRDQCQRFRVPFLFKKNSSATRDLDGREWNEYPEAIR
jgi:protein gp37